MAEEVGVEPTRHRVSASLVLKTRHPTGGRRSSVWPSLTLEPLPGKVAVQHQSVVVAAAREADVIEVFQNLHGEIATHPGPLLESDHGNRFAGIRQCQDV